MNTEELLSRVAQLWQSIHAFTQRVGRVKHSDLLQLEQTIRLNEHCDAEEARFILHCYGRDLVDVPPMKRTQMALSFWKFLEDSPSFSFGIEHYSALLIVFLDNGHDFEPLEFLAWMEERDKLYPNQLIFELVNDRYCLMGDKEASTLIIQHMKAENIQVRARVFRSLIFGLSGQGDVEGAKEVIANMDENELRVNSVTLMMLLRGMIHGGAKWSEVRAEWQKAKEDGVQFDDQDHFDILIELVKREDRDQAAIEEVYETLPKAPQFIDRVRNNIPRMVFAGETEIPQRLINNHIYADLIPQMNSVLLRALLKTPVSEPKKVINIIERVLSNPAAIEGADNVVLKSLVEGLLDDANPSLFAPLAKHCKARYAKEIRSLDMRQYFSSRALSATSPEAVQLMARATQVGVEPSNTVFSCDVCPVLLSDLRYASNPFQAYKDIEDQGGVKFLGGFLSFNALVIHHLLHLGDAQSARKALELFLRRTSTPHLSTTVLANWYLTSRDAQYVIDYFFIATLVSQRMWNQRSVVPFLQKLSVKACNQPEILEEVMAELAEGGIGVSEKDAEAFKREVRLTPPLAAHLDTLVSNEHNQTDIWPFNRINEKANQLRRELNIPERGEKYLLRKEKLHHSK